ncbi:MAG: hypothetical protein PWQ67_475 [Clostridia bacterium]|jgi:DNA-binding transcriptional LysR family regulator|nr:hypothetical protein [Clostridia bacterium]MDN5322021.1 hypothetical protein [Clostridia bacterium]
MELRQLEYFIAVSKYQNFTRAAESLHVAQPSITTSIKKLEDELGIKLFERNKKSIQLTDEGKIFYKRIKKILQDLDEAVFEIRDLSNLNKGSIKLGLPPMIGAYLFPNIFTHFKEAYPQLDLQVSEEGSIATHILIEKGELDLGIIIIPKDTKDLNILPITEEKIMLCLAPKHKLSNEKVVSFNQLKDEKFILLKKDSYHRQAIINQCEKYGYSPQVIFSSSRIETIKALVASGAGISFLMNMVTQNSKNFVSIPLKEEIKITIGLAWKRDKYLSKASQAFINYIKDYIVSPNFTNIKV